MYCHQGGGAVKILFRPQSNVLVRERFSLRAGSGFASLCKSGDFRHFLSRQIDGAAGVGSGCVCLVFGARTCIATKGMAQ